MSKRKPYDSHEALQKKLRKCVSNTTFSKYRKQLHNFLALEEKFSSLIRARTVLIQASDAMDTLTQLDRIQTRHDEYEKELQMAGNRIKPGDYMWACILGRKNLIIFRVLELAATGHLTMILMHHPSKIDNVWKVPIKVGSQISIKMKLDGSFPLYKTDIELSHARLEDLPVTSMLANITPHPLQDIRVFERLMVLSAIDFIFNEFL